MAVHPHTDVTLGAVTVSVHLLHPNSNEWDWLHGTYVHPYAGKHSPGMGIGCSTPMGMRPSTKCLFILPAPLPLAQTIPPSTDACSPRSNGQFPASGQACALLPWISKGLYPEAGDGPIEYGAVMLRHCKSSAGVGRVGCVHLGQNNGGQKDKCTNL